MADFRGKAIGALVGAGAALLPLPAATGSASPRTIEVDARPIETFDIGSETKRFGPLEFVGGLEFTSGARNFGSFSALRFLSPGADFVSVSDTGFWAFGRIERDASGRPSGISGFRMEQMQDAEGRTTDAKWRTDAEGLGIDGGTAIVGFERNHRLARYELSPEGMGPAAGTLDFLVPKRELRNNRGFETVAVSQADGPLAGVTVIVSEKSLDADGNIFAAVLSGPEKGIFSVARTGYDITDGAFLPDGDLLLLERSFSMAEGVAMRLRRIEAGTIGKGKLADGPVLFEADMGYQIDNMEGLDVWRREDGSLMVSLISDDNNSILQRNLYLEFRLVD